MKAIKYELKEVRKKESEKGIVLVLVIIIIAILTILVGDMIYFTHIDTEISSNIKDQMRARYIAKSGIHVAAGTIKAQALEELTDISTTLSLGVDNSEGYWAINVPFFPVGEGGVAVTVIDERSKVNLNALINPSTNRVDQQVLTELQELFKYLEVEDSKSERFLASLTNWLDAPLVGAKNDQDSQGANSGFYTSLEEPYGIKDGPLDSVQEIRMIDGMDDEFYNRIKHFVTVYPKDKKINFTTASKIVLMAAIKGATVASLDLEEGNEKKQNREPIEVTDDMAEQIADDIIASRGDDIIISQGRAREIAREADPTAEISAGLVGVAFSSGKSDIFSVKAVGSLGEYNPTKRVIEAVLRKSRDDADEFVDIISWKEL
jgi:type II secretory pathway component PulK